MRKSIFLIIGLLISVLVAKSQSTALLRYNPSNEICEYAQLNFVVEDVKTGKPSNIVFSNGLQNENITKEFSNIVELYNFVGRIGWSFLTENKNVEKNKINYVVLFMRKIPVQGRSGQFNQPSNKPFSPDTFRGQPRNNKPRTP